MMQKHLLPLSILFLLFAVAPFPAKGQGSNPVYLPLVRAVGPPAAVDIFLKWKHGGCYTSWCETGWYSSPATADVNGDGRDDIIASAYSLWAINGINGAVIWSKPSGGRTWPGVVVADIDRSGVKDIVIAQSGGLVRAFSVNGAEKWERQPAGNSGELRGLLVADLDGGNSSLEVVVTRAFSSATNTWALDANGNTRAGWPQLSQANIDAGNGYGWGVYNANLAAANIVGDNQVEVVVPSDVHYINAYALNGSLLPVNTSVYPSKQYWGQVGVWENLAVEQRSWGGDCESGIRAESYRANFANGPAVITDVNGDGKREIVVTGNMYQCTTGYPSRYTAVFVFNGDRTRFKASGYDWSQAPIDTGAPLSEDYNVIESVQTNPAVADLDGDGKKEILFASYDGRVHAFWLDKTEHGSWPYSVTKAGEGIIRFASEPVIVDVENDGKAEVIFTSWVQKDSNKTGKLHLLRWDGVVIKEIDLPLAFSGSWNGALAAPTLANIDTDPDLEIILNTAHSGVVVYDLNGSADARVLWGTGRGNYNRDGSN